MSKTIIEINPRYNELKEYIDSIASNGVQNGVIIYDARNKIFKERVGGIDLTIKCFKKPSLFNRLIYTFFRKSKARRSFENAMQLTALEIGSPAPIAYIECHKGGLLENSYYLCLMLEANDIRNWHRIDNNDEVINHTAKFMAEIHSKGVYHKDFSPGNILYDKDFNFYLIDINRMKFGIDNPSILMQNFKCLHDSPEETAKIARYYAQHINSNDVNAVIDAALCARNQYKSQQARKRKLKKIFKRSK